MATRSPWADAHGVEGERHAPGPVVHLAVGDGARASPATSGSSTTATRSPVDERGPVEEVADRQRDAHATPDLSYRNTRGGP